jgi:hypothetical protein
MVELDAAHKPQCEGFAPAVQGFNWAVVREA